MVCKHMGMYGSNISNEGVLHEQSTDAVGQAQAKQQNSVSNCTSQWVDG